MRHLETFLLVNNLYLWEDKLSLWTVKKVSDLDSPLVLAPERYDPRREFPSQDVKHTSWVRLGELVHSIRTTVSPTKEPSGQYLVLDTSDAREGLVVTRKVPIEGGEIGSAKKLICPNDVIISRLRPYLRQVAFVDSYIPRFIKGITLVCSTEFFVLRSVNELSIAFLVPFLLSSPIQQILAASQEGGHHPRFDENTLLNLLVPCTLVEKRATTSKFIEKSAELYRESGLLMTEQVSAIESQMVA